MKYKIRASKSYDLISACFDKVRMKMEWKEKKEEYSDSLINLAIEIFNKVEFGYEEPKVITHDTNNGTKMERDAILLYDKINKTNYIKEYDKRNKSLPYEMENEFMTGTRDFGDKKTTLDSKISTCKNVFDNKRFQDVVLSHTFQMNGYNFLYGTTEIFIVNSLFPPPLTQIEKFVNTERYFNYEKDDEYFDKLQEKYEDMFAYDEFHGYSDELRQDVREVQVIENFNEMIAFSVKKMNKFIEFKLVPTLKK